MTQASKAASNGQPPAMLPAVDEPAAAEGPRELDLTVPSDFVEVPIPYGQDEYICPSCGQAIPTRKQINLSKPARYAHMLNDVMKCWQCSFIFSYKTTTVRVLKQ